MEKVIGTWWKNSSEEDDEPLIEMIETDNKKYYLKYGGEMKQFGEKSDIFDDDHGCMVLAGKRLHAVFSPPPEKFTEDNWSWARE